MKNKCLLIDPAVELDYFLKKLRDNGNRITRQKKALARAILQFKKPFSSEELCTKFENSGIDASTIYRSIASFLDLSLLGTVDFSDGTKRYEYLPKCGHHHHHVVCTECKSVEAIDICGVQEEEKKIAKMGYTNIFHKLEFFGLCRSCTRSIARS